MKGMELVNQIPSMEDIVHGGIYSMKSRDLDGRAYTRKLIVLSDESLMDYGDANGPLTIEITSNEYTFWSIPLPMPKSGTLGFFDDYGLRWWLTKGHFLNALQLADDGIPQFFGIVHPAVVDLIKRVVTRHYLTDGDQLRKLIDDVAEYKQWIGEQHIPVHVKHFHTGRVRDAEYYERFSDGWTPQFEKPKLKTDLDAPWKNPDFSFGTSSRMEKFRVKISERALIEDTLRTHTETNKEIVINVKDSDPEEILKVIRENSPEECMRIFGITSQYALDSVAREATKKRLRAMSDAQIIEINKIRKTLERSEKILLTKEIARRDLVV